MDVEGSKKLRYQRNGEPCKLQLDPTHCQARAGLSRLF